MERSDSGCPKIGVNSSPRATESAILEQGRHTAANTMSGRLESIRGPLNGKTVKLLDGQVSIGRQLTNSITIRDISVSRRHCNIQKDNGEYVICDLASQNGTYVNGVPVQRQPLKDGDEITIGNCAFIFHEREPEALDTPAPGPDSNGRASSEQRTDRTTIIIRRKDLVYLQPGKLLRSGTATDRIFRDFDALIQAATAIHSVRGLSALARRLIEIILAAVPAERGEISLMDAADDVPDVVFTLDRFGRSVDRIDVSRTVIRRAMNEQIGMLIEDASDEMSRNISETLLAKASQSVIVAPLTTVEKTLGVIYLETTDMNHRFDEAHLQLVSAIANSAAIAIENARHLEWLETQLWNEDADEYKMLGESKAMQEVFRMITRVAPANATVLLGGESGTGKELVARALHRGSPRKNKPYMKVDCTQLSAELIESELFGHEKGAFTTAILQKKGKLEVADGGTVFLDEIGELVPAVQAKLLRVLEDREFERVGSNRSIKVDVRIIAATHRDLQQLVREGKFREDLYFRLNVVRITVPPLRERKSDVAELAEHFAARAAAGTGRRIRGISSEALELLRHYDWPGNVRELRNTIERAVVLGSSDMILPDDLAESILESDRSPSVKVTGYHQAVNEFKKQLVIRAIDEAGGNITKAATALDLHPNNLHRLIRNLNIRDEIRSTPPRP